MEFSRPEYCRGLPFCSPGHLPNPRIEPRSPALQADSLPTDPPGKPKNTGVGSLSLLQRSSRPRNRTIAGRFFTNWAIRETLSYQNVQHFFYFSCNNVLKDITRERYMYMKYTLNVFASWLWRVEENTISLQWFVKFYFIGTLLKYNCVPMLCWFPLCDFVNQLCVCTYPLLLEPSSHPTPPST